MEKMAFWRSLPDKQQRQDLVHSVKISILKLKKNKINLIYAGNVFHIFAISMSHEA